MTAEINSFMSKLMQLNSFGFNANLNLSAYGGTIYVNLQVDLGPDDSNLQGKAPSSCKKSNSSRVRRRLRRKEACQNSDVIKEPNLQHNDTVDSENTKLFKMNLTVLIQRHQT